MTPVMNTPQAGILAEIPPQARYVSFLIEEAGALRPALQALQAEVDGLRTVAAFGQSLFAGLGKDLPGLKPGPVIAGALVDIPCQPFALWLWLRGEDRGELLHRERHLAQLLAPAFKRQHSIEAFRHDNGRDLTGYEDGTENPEGEEAVAAAFVSSAQSPALAGSSYVAVQQWLHDFEQFERMDTTAQDHAVGRRRSDNEELDDAPETAHVKRTAQESFDPEAFVLRRSMPWTAGNRAGLVFVAFGCSLDAFESQMLRMSGAEDGLVDALFQFTRPLTGAYAWCPGLRNGRLDLSTLGI